MDQKRLYVFLCVIGTALPLSQFIPWLLEHGININLFFNELFSTRVGSFFGIDVIISALALFTFIYYDSKNSNIKRLWQPVIATLTIGVSFGLPLYLYMRSKSSET